MDKELREILKPWGQVCYTGYVDPANVISAILKLHKQEMLGLIGEDEVCETHDNDNLELDEYIEPCYIKIRNNLRAELRKKVEVDNGK
jgi:hypothetical protein